MHDDELPTSQRKVRLAVRPDLLAATSEQPNLARGPGVLTRTVVER